MTYCPTALALPAPSYALTPSPPWKLSIRRRRVSIKVTMVICTLGDTGWRFGSATSDGGGWIPIRGLTFSGRLSNGVVSRGQEPCALVRLPRELGESYERWGRTEVWGGVEVIVLVWRCLKKIVLHVDKFVFFFFFFRGGGGPVLPVPLESNWAWVLQAVLAPGRRDGEADSPSRVGDVLAALCFSNHVKCFSWALLRARPSARSLSLGSMVIPMKSLCVWNE